MLMTCDNTDGCGEAFQVTQLKAEKMANEIEKTSFICPHCNKEYVAFYTDPEIRGKQNNIRKCKSQHLIKKLKKEIGKDMDNLRKRIEASTK